jgi:hypothetical protein
MADLKAEQVIKRIKEVNGNLAAVARSMGIARMTLYRYMEAHPTIKAALDDARETMLDNAESVLYKKVLDGSTQELLFFLRTQGKSRGYTEKSEVKHSGHIDVSELSDDELRNIVEG